MPALARAALCAMIHSVLMLRWVTPLFFRDGAGWYAWRTGQLAGAKLPPRPHAKQVYVSTHKLTATHRGLCGGQIGKRAEAAVR